MKTDLEQFIYQLILDKRRISNKEISNICKISLPTVRKIINKLIEKKLITQIYGGVELLNPSKRSNNLDLEKDQCLIAKEACKLIHDGDAIFLGPGKTVATLCLYLQQFQNLTVFTNSLYVIEQLAIYSHITVVIVGGLLQRMNMGFSMLDKDWDPNIHISKLFISGAGIKPNKGIFHTIPMNRATEELLATKANQVILLVDKTKFEIEKAFILMPMSMINILITTDDIATMYLSQLEKQNLRIILASSK